MSDVPVHTAGPDTSREMADLIEQTKLAQRTEDRVQMLYDEEFDAASDWQMEERYRERWPDDKCPKHAPAAARGRLRDRGLIKNSGETMLNKTGKVHVVIWKRCNEPPPFKPQPWVVTRRVACMEPGEAIPEETVVLARRSVAEAAARRKKKKS